MTILENTGSGLKDRRSLTTNKKRRANDARSSISRVSSRSASVVSISDPTLLTSASSTTANSPTQIRTQIRRSTGTRPREEPARPRQTPFHLITFQNIASRRTPEAQQLELDFGMDAPSPFAPRFQRQSDSHDRHPSHSPMSLQRQNVNLAVEYSSLQYTSPIFEDKIPNNNNMQHVHTDGDFNGPSFDLLEDITSPSGNMNSSLPVKDHLPSSDGAYKVLSSSENLPALDHRLSTSSESSAASSASHPDLIELLDMAPRKSGLRPLAPPRQFQTRRNVPPIANKSHPNAHSGMWSTWDIFDVYLNRLPPGVRTADIWHAFHTYGPIDSIEIFVDKAGMKQTTGRITFKPAPARDFYATRPEYFLKTKDGKRHLIYANPDRGQKMFLSTPSPVQANVMYPQNMELLAERIDFGVLVKPDTMLIKRTKTRQNSHHVRLVLDLWQKEIQVFFPSLFDKDVTEYKFTVPIDQPLEVGLTKTENPEKKSLVLTLKTPPRYYRKLQKLERTHQDEAARWTGQDAWIRQTGIHRNENEALALNGRPITLRNTPESQINTGRWTTFSISLSKQVLSHRNFHIFKDALRDHNVAIKECDFFFTEVGEAAWALLEDAAHEYVREKTFLAAHPAEENNELDGLFNPVKNISYLPPDVHYQLAVCISQSLINEHNVTPEFLEALSKEDHHRARNRLEMVAEDKLRIFDPMKIFELPMRYISMFRSQTTENYVILRSAVVTPSSLILNSPAIEMTNRVLRKYREHSDRFIRVRFEDDEERGYSRINATRLKTMDGILSRVYRAVTCGITIGDRHFEFLAFGNSQLREHGAYFFASSPNLTASNIRAWMGRFDKEQIVAKHAARMGQCFSTTRAVRTVTFPTVRAEDLIEDVEIGDYCFTDGVGKISRFHAETIARELGIRRQTPSVFQFRMGGCKGVLAIDPELKAMDVKLRKSQFKFETTYSGMEINRWSEYWAATLNRQLILVLSTLGVPDDTFLDLQEALIQQMKDALEDDNAAVEALTRTVDANRMTLTIAGLVQAGFRASKEPFVTSLIHLWRAWSTKYLKEKAKIPVSEGAFVLGCTDETKTLKGHFYNQKIRATDSLETAISKLPQIFIQIIHPATGKRKVITGLCTIARNPSLHAGDIRVVNAIDVPALHHLVDVLVLPQTGDRDLASMCSGGDLDGDDYVVIWDQRLVPPNWTQEPMDYTPPHPRKLDRPVTQYDITKFFVKYMKNDFLPTIARAHLAWADLLDGGVRNEKCLELAMLHSKAVDYPKTGQPAEMGRHLVAKKRPHFMEGKKRSSYHSEKVLGQLYDSVMSVTFQPDRTDTFDERILNACEPDEKIMQAARDLKRGYDVSMQQIMAQHDIKTEFEVWSTFVLDHSKAAPDYKFHEEIGQLAGGLKSRYHAVVVEKAGGNKWSALVPWAVAMYRVTRDEFEAAKRSEENAMPLISFPWILRGTLVQIAKTFDQVKLKGTNLMGLDQTLGFLDPDSEVIDDPYVPETSAEDAAKDVEADLKKSPKIGLSNAEQHTPGTKIDSSPPMASRACLSVLQPSENSTPLPQRGPKSSKIKSSAPGSHSLSPKVSHRKTSSSDYKTSGSSAAASITDLRLTAGTPPTPASSHKARVPATKSNQNPKNVPTGPEKGNKDDLLVLTSRPTTPTTTRPPPPTATGVGKLVALQSLSLGNQEPTDEVDDDAEEVEDPLLAGSMVGEVWA